MRVVKIFLLFFSQLEKHCEFLWTLHNFNSILLYWILLMILPRVGAIADGEGVDDVDVRVDDGHECSDHQQCWPHEQLIHWLKNIFFQVFLIKLKLLISFCCCLWWMAVISLRDIRVEKRVQVHTNLVPKYLRKYTFIYFLNELKLYIRVHLFIHG